MRDGTKQFLILPVSIVGGALYGFFSQPKHTNTTNDSNGPVQVKTSLAVGIPAWGLFWKNAGFQWFWSLPVRRMLTMGAAGGVVGVVLLLLAKFLTAEVRAQAELVPHLRGETERLQSLLGIAEKEKQLFDERTKEVESICAQATDRNASLRSQLDVASQLVDSLREQLAVVEHKLGETSSADASRGRRIQAAAQCRMSN